VKCACAILSSMACWFSLQLYFKNTNIFHSKKKWARYDHKCVWSTRTVPVIILVRFYLNFNFLDRFFFQKCSNIKFHKNLVRLYLNFNFLDRFFFQKCSNIKFHKNLVRLYLNFNFLDRFFFPKMLKYKIS